MLYVGNPADQKQPQQTASLIGYKIPWVKNRTCFPQGGQHFPHQTADKQKRNCLLPGADRGQVAPIQQKIGPGHYGQPGKQIVGIAHQKPMEPSSGDCLEHQAIQQIEAACQQEQGQIDASHKMERRSNAQITPRITAPTVAPKDMPCLLLGL